MRAWRQVHPRYEGATRPGLVLALALAVSHASVSRSQTIVAEPPEETTCTETLLERHHSDAAEARALDETAGRVVREGCTLRFRTPGSEHALTSNLSENAAHVGYLYRGVLPHEYDLVEVRYYERRRYLIINRTGQHWTYVVGEPVVSPDQRRVVATSVDLVAGIHPNAVEILLLEDQFAASLELSISSDDWGPSDATWVDSTTIAFTQNFKPFGDRKETGWLRLTPSGWSFQPGVAYGPAGPR